MRESILLNLKILKNKLASTSAGLTLNEVYRFFQEKEIETPYRDIINVYQQILTHHHDFEVKLPVKIMLDKTLTMTEYDDELISDCPVRELVRKHYLTLVGKSYSEHKAALLLKSIILSIPLNLPPGVTSFQLADDVQSTLHFLLTTLSEEVFMYCDRVSHELAELKEADSIQNNVPS